MKNIFSLILQDYVHIMAHIVYHFYGG